MWVKILEDRGEHRKGEKKELPDREAKTAIKEGWATWVPTPVRAAVRTHQTR